MVASNDPKRNRVTIRPAKSVAAAMQASDTPQRRTLAAMNLPSGNLTRAHAVKGCQMSCAKYTIELVQEYCLPLSRELKRISVGKVDLPQDEWRK